jgi:cell division protease FtsH
MDDKHDSNKPPQPDKKPEKKPRSFLTPLIIFGGIFFLVFLLGRSFEPGKDQPKSYNEFLKDVEDGKVKQITFHENGNAEVELRSGGPKDKYEFMFPPGSLGRETYEKLMKGEGLGELIEAHRKEKAPRVSYAPPGEAVPQITVDNSRDINEFTGHVESGGVATLTIYPNNVGEVVLRKGDPPERYLVAFPSGFFSGETYRKLAAGQWFKSDAWKEKAPEIISAPPRSLFVTILLSWLPWILILFFLYWIFMRQIRSSAVGGGVLGFGKSRAQRSDPNQIQVTFEDVAGIDEAKEEVQEIIEFLKNPSKFQRLGGRIPRGVMLVGAPGTGKTLMAKAIAGEASVPFFSISGSDFVEMFVGVGASRVRDLFRQAKENSPCIVFLDEIDAVGRKRGTGMGGGHDEREQTLNAILVEMDGFTRDEGVILIAATNRPDVLDPALLRPGRFDREIVIDLPDVKGREEILEVHAKKIKLADDIDLSVIARGTPMFSGAELEALINEAAILATMRDSEAVEMEDFEEARDKVRWGRQKKSRVMSEDDKRRTAYHEAGHAILAFLVPEVEPLHKVTIIPRGMSLGATMILPEKDRYTYSKKQALGDIVFAYGGYAAEELFFNERTSGARNDIETASKIARLMVTEWGMNDVLGPINYSETFEHQFLGRDFAGAKQYSEATAQLIDQEIRKIINACRDRARKLISENRESLEKIAEALLKHESLSNTQVDNIMRENGPKKEEDAIES